MIDRGGSEIVFRGRILAVRVDSISRSGGETKREVVESAQVSAVLATRERDVTEVCMVEQYRHPVKRRILEIPAGRVDPGETPEECARRELSEETGYTARRWVPLGSFYSSPGFCTECIHVFSAEDLECAEAPPPGDERDLLVRWLPLDALVHSTDGPLDGKTLAALMLWNKNRKGRCDDSAPGTYT